MKEEIHSLYQKALCAHVSEKLSYDVIDLISLSDRVRNAALRYIRNEERMAEMTRVNNIIASNAKQRLSKSDPSLCDNNSLIIAGGCSGFEPNTKLITQNSIGTVTAALQMQRGGGVNLSNNNDISNSSFSDRPTVNLPLGTQPTDQSLPVTTQHDPIITSNSFNSSSTMGGVILGDARGLDWRLRVIYLCRFPNF